MGTVKIGRAAKYGITAAIAISAYGLDVKINKQDGFDIASQATPPSQAVKNQAGFVVSLGIADASARCGAGLNCSGGGGQCGAGLNCGGQ